MPPPPAGTAAGSLAGSPALPATVSPGVGVAPTASVLASIPPSPVHELRTLVLSRHPAIVLETSEEARADALLGAAASGARLALFEWTVTRGLARRPAGAAVYGSEDPVKALAAIADLGVDGLFVLKDFAAHLTAPALSRAFRELLGRLATPGRLSTIVLVGNPVVLGPEIEPHVVRVDLPLPTREEYAQTVGTVVESLRLGRQAEVTLSAVDIDAFARALSGLTLNQARQAVARMAIEDGRLEPGDGARLVERKAQALHDDSVLEYFPAADNAARIGGFANLRRWLQRARVGFSAEAERLNLPAPRGLLLVGVQGCGKSLAAKSIAREWQLPLLKLDAGRLYDKFVGESERHLRRAIATAESMAPVVLWIDEIEKGLVPSGDREGDGGLSHRLFGSFLTWMQEKTQEVFVVATANDLSMMPPELLRKGRFDEIFFVDLPDPEERAEILRIHLELRRQDPAAFDVAQVAAATEGFSGAELEQAVIASLLGALHTGRALDTDGLLAEVRATVPMAVSSSEQVARRRAYARERFVPVR